MFDAQAKAKAAEGQYPPFPFRGLDGTEYELPNWMLLTQGQMQRLAEGEVTAVIRELDEKACDAVLAMPLHISADFAEAWMEHGGPEGKARSSSSETGAGG